MLTGWYVLELASVFLIGSGLFSFVYIITGKLPIYINIVVGCLAVVCVVMRGVSWQAVCVYALAGTLSAVSYIDMKTMIIPNSLIAVLGIISLCSIIVFPEISFIERVAGLLCVSGPLFIIAVLLPGSFGGGDIKLMAVSGFFAGWKCIVWAFIIAMSAAGICCVCMVLAGKLTRSSKVPLGPFLCIGVIIVVLGLMFN